MRWRNTLTSLNEKDKCFFFFTCLLDRKAKSSHLALNSKTAHSLQTDEANIILPLKKTKQKRLGHASLAKLKTHRRENCAKSPFHLRHASRTPSLTPPRAHICLWPCEHDKECLRMFSSIHGVINPAGTDPIPPQAPKECQ